jgi:mono/diheme cytochrome c family protein
MRFASRAGRIIARAIVAVALLMLVFVALAWRSALDPIEPPTASGFDPALIRHGAELAALGNCRTCHTPSGGAAYAGGRAIRTPFGTVYSTNVTPDPLTGIGRWSQAAFARAMREGVDRQGRQLYPAFPYDHFTLLTDADIAALYAFFMTRQPVRARAPHNEIDLPLRFRPLLAGWKLLFFREGGFHGDDRHDAEWNRGAYLAEGLAHCGACHTPRNVLGAEKKERHFGGGDSEGWHAYAIDAASQSPVPWDVAALDFYLRNGWHPSHGVAGGPMAPVVESLAGVPERDVRAIANYVVSGMGPPTPERIKRAEALRADVVGISSDSRAAGKIIPQAAGVQAPPSTPASTAGNKVGAILYGNACANCHDAGQPLPFGGINLALSIGVSGEDPTNLLHVVRDGLPATGEAPQPVMPGFTKTVSDRQLLLLLSYLRSRFAGKPLWPHTEAIIRRDAQ